MFDNQAKTDMEVFDNEDHTNSNDSDESQNVDDKLDMFDECDDESDDSSSFRDSENSDCSSSEQLSDGGSDNDNSVGESAHVVEQHTEHESADASADCSDLKEDLGLKESAADLSTTSEASVPDTSSEGKYNSALSMQTALTATLAVSTVSGTYSQPLFVSVTSNNVKSEHIWVPPRLSPHSEPHHPHHTQNSNIAVKPETQTPAERGGHCRPDDHTAYDQSKNSDKQNVSKKPETVPPPKEVQQLKELQQVQQPKAFPQAVVKVESHVPGTTPTKEFQSIERHLGVNFEHDRSDPRGESCHVKPTQESYLAASEKSSRDKEREEKYRQKLKEERNRKEREERNRKDRERDERRERERREEKDAERRRQEEKERREMAKAHAENSGVKEGSSSVDHSRRPPGGVAEAAAFSDYMRVLAAGHAHPYM